MRIYAIVLFILFCFIGCGPKGPTTVEMERDIKQYFITEEKMRLEKSKQAEDESIRKHETVFSPSERNQAMFLFEHQDWGKYLNSFINEMETLKVISSNIEGDILYGTANYLNSFGSKMEVPYTYIKTQKGWEFDKIMKIKILEMSPQEKNAPQGAIQSAIIIYYAENERYPKDLKELVPKYILKIPEGNWVYDNKTGKVNVNK